jgi:hypothetical protein
MTFSARLRLIRDRRTSSSTAGPECSNALAIGCTVPSAGYANAAGAANAARKLAPVPGGPSATEVLLQMREDERQCFSPSRSVELAGAPGHRHGPAQTGRP